MPSSLIHTTAAFLQLLGCAQCPVRAVGRAYRGSSVNSQPVVRVCMPDRRGRSYREWSSDESESEESESDHASEPLPPPPRARTVAVEPSPFTVTASQETMPFAMDVSSFRLMCAYHLTPYSSVVFLPSGRTRARGLSSCSIRQRD